MRALVVDVASNTVGNFVSIQGLLQCLVVSTHVAHKLGERCQERAVQVAMMLYKRKHVGLRSLPNETPRILLVLAMYATTVGRILAI